MYLYRIDFLDQASSVYESASVNVDVSASYVLSLATICNAALMYMPSLHMHREGG